MKLRLLLLFLVLSSCKDINLKKIDENDLVEEELKSINWNSIDEYPSFERCDSLPNQSTEACFKETLINHINTELANAALVVTEDVSDTVILQLFIDSNGTVQVESITAKQETYSSIPDLDSIMQSSIKSLPKVFPATKRGQPVKTEFALPVVLVIK